jgi:hypothetical protein
VEVKEIRSNTYVIKKNRIIKKDYTIFIVFPNRKFIRKNPLRRLLNGENLFCTAKNNKN